MRRALLVIVAVSASTMTGGQAFAAPMPTAAGRSGGTGVSVGGQVTAPKHYSVADIVALPGAEWSN